MSDTVDITRLKPAHRVGLPSFPLALKLGHIDVAQRPPVTVQDSNHVDVSFVTPGWSVLALTEYEKSRARRLAQWLVK